ncbi:hypothetical protein FAIPA1_380031 [Frankia sp. AiPs1]
MHPFRPQRKLVGFRAFFGVSRLLHTHFSVDAYLNASLGGFVLFIPAGAFSARHMIRTGMQEIKKRRSQR